MKNAVKYLSYLGKALGLVGSLNVIPGLSQEKSVLIFFVASLLKDTVNRVGDYLDDGKVNDSFKP